MSMYKRKADIIIKNGIVVDGSGILPFYADIAIKGDKIDFVGNLDGAEAEQIIDASGKYVTPGFIDVHSHSDFTLWADPSSESSVRQGITTEVVGNCGYSMKLHLKKEHFDPRGDSVKCVYDMNGEENIPEGAMAAVLDKADAMGRSINTAWLCGHNDLRVIAGVNTEEATEEQFAVMEKFLREALEAGFIGFSTGLEFDPGILCKPEEVERLAKIVKEYDGHYSTHMRDEGTYILESIEEFLNVIRKTGLTGSVSHLNVKYDNGIPNDYIYKGMQMLKDAREKEHLNVYTDMLPTTFAPGAALAILPPWLYAEGWDKAKEILADVEGRKKVKADLNRYWRFLGAGQWDRLLKIQPAYWPEIGRLPFSEVVEMMGKEPVDCFLDIMAAAPDIIEARKVPMQGTVFFEETVIDTVIKDPIYLWITDGRISREDGPLSEIAGSMQNFMTMTYFFTRYVRDLGMVPIEKAVAKLTNLAAKHFNLKKRGMIEEGYFADINVFDLGELKINANFDEPCRFSEGMDYVLVNGKPVLVKGKPTGTLSGKVLRHLPVE